MAVTLQLDAPGIKKLVDELAALLRQDAQLRSIQGANAPIASNFDAATLGAGALINIAYKIAEAQSGSKVFSFLVIVFESTSGLGRYRTDGIAATPAVGFEIPAGGGTLIITGQNNIQGFSMINQAGPTLLPFARQLYT